MSPRTICCRDTETAAAAAPSGAQAVASNTNRNLKDPELLRGTLVSKPGTERLKGRHLVVIDAKEAAGGT